MATDLSEAEPVHHKALPLLTGAQLIHTDKLSEVGAGPFSKLALGSVIDFQSCWRFLGTLSPSIIGNSIGSLISPTGTLLPPPCFPCDAVVVRILKCSSHLIWNWKEIISFISVKCETILSWYASKIEYLLSFKILKNMNVTRIFLHMLLWFTLIPFQKLSESFQYLYWFTNAFYRKLKTKRCRSVAR